MRREEAPPQVRSDRGEMAHGHHQHNLDLLNLNPASTQAQPDFNLNILNSTSA